jgi:predicted RNA-binding Zn-ribbon protein involved in translation (DUF1610 family)
MAIEARPCPFCGSTVKVRNNPLTGGVTFMCDAPHCGADVMFYAGDRKGTLVNFTLWNRRDGVPGDGE